MKHQKAVWILMTVALAFSALLVATPQRAWAANTKDTTYSFVFHGSNTQGTAGRKKRDASPVYVRVHTFTVDVVNFYVDGGETRKGPWRNLTVGGSVKLTKQGNANMGGKYRIRTNVKEAGCGYARLTGWTGGSRGKVRGVWSPDSKYTYVPLN